MNPLKSKHYPRIMHLIIALVFILIFFSIISLEDAIVKNITKSVTGYAVNPASSQNSTTKTNFSASSFQGIKEEVYSTKSHMIFYISLIALITAIFIVFLSLKSSVLKNIEKENTENKF